MCNREVAGISFVGTLTTLAVLALLLAIALPSWQGMRQRQLLRAAALAVESAFQLAHADARRRNHTVYVHLETKANGRLWCFLVSDHRDCSCQQKSCRGYQNFRHDQRDYPGVQLSVFPRHGRIAFFPLRQTSSAGSVHLVTGKDERRVIVSSSGRIRRCAKGLAQEQACR